MYTPQGWDTIWMESKVLRGIFAEERCDEVLKGEDQMWCLKALITAKRR